MKEGTSPQTPWSLRNIEEYNEQLLAAEFDNLGEIDQFHETHNLPELTHEEIGNLNRSISIKEIELRKINFQKRKPSQMGSLVNSTKDLRKKLYQISTISSRRFPPEEFSIKDTSELIL